ncbi:MAG: S8 family serine peptidase [Planctomycetota bacterium]
MMDGNDTFAEAVHLGSLANESELNSDQLTTGFTIHPVTDVDMFAFRAVEGQHVEVEIDGDSTSARQLARVFSPDIRYDSIELLTATSDGTLSFIAQESSTFYVGVSEASNQFYSPTTGGGDLVSPNARTGGYTLRIREIDGRPVPNDSIDLVPESPIAPPSANPGETVTPWIEIDNRGNQRAGDYQVDFYLSTNDYISSFDTKLATVTRSGFAAGTSDSWAQSLTLPSDLVPGTYYLGIIVDADGLVDTVPETSNIEYTAITIEAAPPSLIDLDPVAIVAPQNVTPGSTLTARVEIENTGNSDADPYDVDFYLSTNSAITFLDTKLTTTTRAGIAAGQRDVWNQSLTLPSDLSPGTYYLGIIVDADGLVDNVPETDNVVYTQITIEELAPPPPPPQADGDSVGFYNPGRSQFELRQHLAAGSEVDMIANGSFPSSWLPLVGDWDGNGTETVGLYDPSSSVFHLSNSTQSSGADVRFQFGPGGFAGWTPLAGDWNGDGIDTIGFYQPDLSLFHLKDSFTPGASDQYFGFGPSGNAGWTPMVGDWNGDGVDTVGFYEPGQSLFHLKDSFTPGRSDQYFGFGPAYGGWTPLGGDWNGDGIDTIGLYDRSAGMFHLKDSFTPGASDHYVAWSSSDARAMPIIGRWGDSQNDPAIPQPLPEVPSFGGFNDWNLNLVGAPEAWAAGYTGQGVTVAVVDSGVDVLHPDLTPNIFINPNEIANGIDDDGNGYVDDIFGYDFENQDPIPEDEDGHGTHVSGTIAAAMDGTGATGVAPGATILPLKTKTSGYVFEDFVTPFVEAINYAVDMGARVINVSLGGDDFRHPHVMQAFARAYARDALIVVSAGNEAISEDATAPGYPARYSETFPNVISVGAHTRFDGIASFSNPVGSSGAVQVDAPGTNIYSTVPIEVEGRRNYANLDGTSMAAPHVAGLAALILSANPSLNAAEVRNLITMGVRGQASGSDSIGMIDARMSVAYAAAGWTGAYASLSTSSPQNSTNDLVDELFSSLSSHLDLARDASTESFQLSGPSAPMRSILWDVDSFVESQSQSAETVDQRIASHDRSLTEWLNSTI